MRLVNKVLCPRCLFRCLFCDFSRHWGEICTLMKASRQQRFAEVTCLRFGCSHRRFPKFFGSGKHSVKILRNCSITPESLRSTPGFGRWMQIRRRAWHEPNFPEMGEFTDDDRCLGTVRYRHHGVDLELRSNTRSEGCSCSFMAIRDEFAAVRRHCSPAVFSSSEMSVFGCDCFESEEAAGRI